MLEQASTVRTPRMLRNEYQRKSADTKRLVAVAADSVQVAPSRIHTAAFADGSVHLNEKLLPKFLGQLTALTGCIWPVTAGAIVYDAGLCTEAKRVLKKRRACQKLKSCDAFKIPAAS